MLCVPFSAWDEKHSTSLPLNGEKRRSQRGGEWREKKKKKKKEGGREKEKEGKHMPRIVCFDSCCICDLVPVLFVFYILCTVLHTLFLVYLTTPMSTSELPCLPPPHHSHVYLTTTPMSTLPPLPCLPHSTTPMSTPVSYTHLTLPTRSTV